MPPLRAFDLSEALAKCHPNEGGDSFCTFLVNCVAYRGTPIRILADHGILRLNTAKHGVPQRLASLSGSVIISTTRLRVTPC